jgi:hypothetical protein
MMKTLDRLNEKSGGDAKDAKNGGDAKNGDDSDDSSKDGWLDVLRWDFFYPNGMPYNIHKDLVTKKEDPIFYGGETYTDSNGVTYVLIETKSADHVMVPVVYETEDGFDYEKTNFRCNSDTTSFETGGFTPPQSVHAPSPGKSVAQEQLTIVLETSLTPFCCLLLAQTAPGVHAPGPKHVKATRTVKPSMKMTTKMTTRMLVLSVQKSPRSMNMMAWKLKLSTVK